MALALPAPAKVNLFLRVLGRRPDGYHELETVFHSLALADRLVVDHGDSGIELTVARTARTGLAVPDGPANLVRRAAAAWCAAAGVDAGLRFWLDKRIPAGGGLGGGSSDAAAALSLCDALHGDRLGRARLLDLAVRLGADVPFFVAGGGTRLGRGIGEILTPCPDPPHLHFVLVLPPFGTSTATVFENHKPHLPDGPSTSTIPPLEALSAAGFGMMHRLGNELEAAAWRSYPELRRLRDEVVRTGFPGVRMSGSGSTLFVVSPTMDGALTVERALEPVAARFGAVLLRTESGSPIGEPEPVPWPGSSREGG
jgi:4-diphosphocytidyl-2-C-methyl-D-erythritol kinase